MNASVYFRAFGMFQLTAYHIMYRKSVVLWGLSFHTAHESTLMFSLVSQILRVAVDTDTSAKSSESQWLHATAFVMLWRIVNRRVIVIIIR